jgi:hypothetical protein
MLKKNSMVTGILAALVFPAMAVAAAYLLKSNLYIINKPALPHFIAIACNLVLIRICAKKELPDTSRGIMITTIVFMLLVLFTIVHPLK